MSASRDGHASARSDREDRHPFIDGISALPLFRLLWRNRFNVSRKRFRELARIAWDSMFVTVMNWMERQRFGTRIERTGLVAPPVFVIGHWRTGTTYLHKLLSLDPAMTSPTLYQCSLPECFITCPPRFRRLLAERIPARRPMDNVKLGPEEPFEDEFALMKTTLVSPYLNLVFPESPVNHERFLELCEVDHVTVRRWQRSLSLFLKRITFATGKRVVLKSPTHSCRVRVLLEMFPDARFVMIQRDPYTVVASTRRLWPRLLSQNTWQDRDLGGLDELVYSRFMRVFECLREQTPLIPSENFALVRYEDLEKDPAATMRSLYEHLDLGSFEDYRPHLQQHIDSSRGYRKNSYSLDDGQRREIYDRLRPVFEAWGYER